MEQTKRFTIATCLLLFVGFIVSQCAYAQDARQEAWTTLNAGLADQNTAERAMAVRVLGLLTNDPRAPELAMKALDDPKPEVKAAGAQAVGQLKYQAAAPKLKEILLGNDTDVSLVLECARALIALGDDSGYGVYYAILTGERKSGTSLAASQKKMLSDPKKMAKIGFEQGIGFIPFGGLGYGAIKAFTRDDESPVRAAATKMLVNDPDPKTQEALINASNDKSWIVRIAAVDALARRGDPTVIPQLKPRLTDEKDVVKYTAAAAIIRLSDLQSGAGAPAEAALATANSSM